jgi:hypothetical protein
MHLAIYAHPFDVDALASQGGLQRLGDLGFREIALAVSYHDGRWLMPWHPDGRVRFLEDGTVHFRPGPDYGLLRPQPSSLVDPQRPSPLERLCEQAPPAGLSVRAWTVCTHNSRLGALHPELCVENAFGDRYPYALCPSQPAVQAYVHGMVADLVAHEGLAAIELEAFGWMGWKHSSHHDKASFTPRGSVDYALSLCCCKACESRLQAEGGDPAATRAWARAEIRRTIEAGDAMAPAAVVPPDVAAADLVAAARSARAATLQQFGRAVRQLFRSDLACALQVHPAADFTGSQLPVAQAHGLRADEWVVTAYGESIDGMQALVAGATRPADAGPPPRRRLCIWPKAPQCTGDEDLVRVRQLATDQGIGAISVYHLGLLPWRTIERVARVLTA